MTTRRKFIKQLSAAGILSTAPDLLLSQQNKPDNKIWACLLHLSFNMWEEYISPHRPFRGFRPDLELSESLWTDAVKKVAEQGMNMIVIDLGDAVRYDSHPEIAVRNAWSTKRLREELNKMRRLGLETIPKLNFSTGHDTWMGEYSRMVSTKEYYNVCSDLISEVCELFDKPRFFHLGMDEEGAVHQAYYNYLVIRQNDLWWHDFNFLVREVEKSGAQAWIWSDYMLWNYLDQFIAKMPKSVIQSNWYYGENFDPDEPHKSVKAYLDLEKYGYDQIPTGSYHAENEKSIENTVKFCTEHISDSHLVGFLQTFWKPTIEEYRERIIKGIRLAGEARKLYNKITG